MCGALKKSLSKSTKRMVPRLKKISFALGLSLFLSCCAPVLSDQEHSDITPLFMCDQQESFYRCVSISAYVEMCREILDELDEGLITQERAIDYLECELWMIDDKLGFKS